MAGKSLITEIQVVTSSGMVNELDLAENTGHCQVGFEGTLTTLTS
jgi:hypothetical protein